MLVLYFLTYVFFSGFQVGPRFFQFLTQWGLVSYTVYLICAALSVTYTYMHTLVCKRPPHKLSNQPDIETVKPPGCCGSSLDATSWYHKIQWLLFTVGTEIALTITIMFWSVLYDPERIDVDHIQVAIHILNGITAYVDLWVTGVPVRVYHVLYLVLFGCLYVSFTGIHHAALVETNITNPIYPILDYGSNPGSSSALAIIITLVFLPFIHMVFYVSYLLREGIILLAKRYSKSLKMNDSLDHTFKDKQFNEYPLQELTDKI